MSLQGDGRKIVLMDVDGVISDGLIAHRCTPRPGIVLLCDLLMCLGYSIHLWSAGGYKHAEDVAAACGIYGSVMGYHDKPDRPMTEEGVYDLLGTLPVMQIDDESTERVGGWPFFKVDSFLGSR